MTRTSKTHKQTPRWAQDSSAVKCLKWMLFNKVLQPLGYWNEDTFHTMNATVMFSREIVFLHLALRKWIGINPGVTLKWIIEQIQYSYSAMYYQVASTDKPPKILIQSLLLEKKKQVDWGEKMSTKLQPIVSPHTTLYVRGFALSKAPHVCIRMRLRMLSRSWQCSVKQGFLSTWQISANGRMSMWEQTDFPEVLWVFNK